MNIEHFTIKAQEAVQSAVKRAIAGRHSNLTPIHLMQGVLDVGENVTHFIFQKMDVDEQALRTSLDRLCDSMPKAGAQRRRKRNQ